MSEYHEGRRQFLRYKYDSPIKFNAIQRPRREDKVSDLFDAMTKNLSASGILFTTDVHNVPAIASLLVIDLDLRTANICKEIEGRALILDNKLIGRVVRIEDNGDGTFDVGVAFITKTDPLSAGLHHIEDLIKR